MDSLVRRVRHRRPYRIGEACAALGARTSTIARMTGIPQRQVRRLFFDGPESGRRGAKPYSVDWLYKASLVERTQASALLTIYRRMTQCDLPADDALIAAYQFCLGLFAPVGPGITADRHAGSQAFRVNFDRAFALVSHLDGIWAAKARTLTQSTCPQCRSDYVHTVRTQAIALADCPFCVLMRQYPKHHRYQLAFDRA